MVRFINAYTGVDMWVDEARVEEYKAAGHRPAADAAPAPAEKKPAGKSRKKEA